MKKQGTLFLSLGLIAYAIQTIVLSAHLALEEHHGPEGDSSTAAPITVGHHVDGDHDRDGDHEPHPLSDHRYEWITPRAQSSQQLSVDFQARPFEERLSLLVLPVSGVFAHVLLQTPGPWHRETQRSRGPPAAA